LVGLLSERFPIVKHQVVFVLKRVPLGSDFFGECVVHRRETRLTIDGLKDVTYRIEMRTNRPKKFYVFKCLPTTKRMVGKILVNLLVLCARHCQLFGEL